MANQIAESNFRKIIPFLSKLQNQIIKILELNGPMSRNQLVKELSNARTTIYDNLVKLERIKLIKKHIYNNGLIGRPLVYWQLI